MRCLAKASRLSGFLVGRGRRRQARRRRQPRLHDSTYTHWHRQREQGVGNREPFPGAECPFRFRSMTSGLASTRCLISVDSSCSPTLQDKEQDDRQDHESSAQPDTGASNRSKQDQGENDGNDYSHENRSCKQRKQSRRDGGPVHNGVPPSQVSMCSFRMSEGAATRK
jgi:hypothetical protein